MNKLQSEPQTILILRKLREILLRGQCGKLVEFENDKMQHAGVDNPDLYPFIYLQIISEAPSHEKSLGAVMRLTVDVDIFFLDQFVEVRAEYVRKQVDDVIAANVSLDGTCIHCLFAQRTNSFFSNNKGAVTLRYNIDFSYNMTDY